MYTVDFFREHTSPRDPRTLGNMQLVAVDAYLIAYSRATEYSSRVRILSLICRYCVYYMSVVDQVGKGLNKSLTYLVVMGVYKQGLEELRIAHQLFRAQRAQRAAENWQRLILKWKASQAASQSREPDEKSANRPLTRREEDMLGKMVLVANRMVTARPEQVQALKREIESMVRSNLAAQASPSPKAAYAAAYAAVNQRFSRGPASPQMSKSLSMEDLWRELLDPRHRPGWIRGPLNTNIDLFRAWEQTIERSKLRARAQGDSLHHEYVESYFDFLDRYGYEALGGYQVMLTASEVARQAFEIEVKGTMLFHRATIDMKAQAFDSSGMLVNSKIWRSNQLAPLLQALRVGGSDEKVEQKHAKPRELPGRALWVISPEQRIFSSSNMILGATGIHHSTFTAGGRVLCGGEWEVSQGKLKVISHQSGHYQPTFAQFVAALRVLRQKGVNLKDVALELPMDAAWTMKYFNAEQVAQLEPVANSRGPGQGYEWPTKVNRRLAAVLKDQPTVHIDPVDGQLLMQGNKVLLTRPSVAAANPINNSRNAPASGAGASRNIATPAAPRATPASRPAPPLNYVYDEPDEKR
jgi:hypothetical protein